MSSPTRPTRATRTPHQVAVEPGQVLPARRTPYLRDAVVVAALGLGSAGALDLAGHDALSLPALALGVAGASAVGMGGARSAARSRLVDRTVEALAPLLGVRAPTRALVRARRGFCRGWPGCPRRLAIRYAPGAEDAQVGWAAAVAAVVGQRMQQRYLVASHDKRRCLLVLDLDTAKPGEQVEPVAAQVRAQAAASELIGPTTALVAAEVEGQELRAITFSHGAGAKLAAAGYRARVERVFSTMLPGRWRASFDLEADTVRFEVRPTLPASVWLPTDVPAVARRPEARSAAYVPYAVDEDGAEMRWYPARVPHMMLTGSTGTGKTSTAHALLGKITQYGWPVWVLDAKRVEFLGFRTWPGVQVVAGTIAAQVALIHRAWTVMETRYALIEAGTHTVADFEPLVIFLDEFAEFRSNLMEWYAQVKVRGDPSKPPTLAEVASLARKARTARIHLVLSTQRPDAEFLTGEMRDNFGARVSMGRLSPQGAMMMWENPTVGVSLPRAVTGRAMAACEDGRVVEVQCYRFPDLDATPGSAEHARLLALRPTTSEHRRLRIVLPDPEDNLDTGESVEPTFREIADAPWAFADAHPGAEAPAGAAGEPSTAEQRRLAASPLAILGLADHHGPLPEIPTAPPEVPPAAVGVSVDKPTAPRLHVVADPTPTRPRHVQAGDDDLDDGDLLDEEVGYGPPAALSPSALLPGDLIEVEPGTGHWVVVEDLPTEDVTDPGRTTISWRGAGDEAGAICLPDDELITARTPLENT